MIEYYRTFLTHLYALLAASNLASKTEFRVFGRSLSGFEVHSQEQEDEAGRIQSKDGGMGPPYGLQAQIVHAEKALEDLIRGDQENGADNARVVLMGHSVEAYMLLEIIRRTREKVLKDKNSGVRIADGVSLFPTVTYFATSRNGKKYGVSCFFARSPVCQPSNEQSLILFIVAPTYSALCLLSLLTRQGTDTSHSCQYTLTTVNQGQGSPRGCCSDFCGLFEECVGSERDAVGDWCSRTR